MKSILTFIFLNACSLIIVPAQDTNQFNRKGFIFGTSFGISSLRFKTATVPLQTQESLSFPNLKIGKMISKRSAIVLYLPGNIYTYNGGGRQRDRGFEGIIPSIQYWIKDRWWTMVGTGITFDAPAFYDIKNEEERKFYFGNSIIAGAGYEVWRKRNFAIDLQSRIQYGNTNMPQGKRKGVAVSFLIGFNLY